MRWQLRRTETFDGLWLALDPDARRMVIEAIAVLERDPNENGGSRQPYFGRERAMMYRYREVVLFYVLREQTVWLLSVRRRRAEEPSPPRR